jgi:hypothetical protein
MIPSYVPVNLTTTYLEQYIGGFVKTYGDNVPVEVYVKATDYPKSLFTPGVMGANLALEIRFIV